MSKRTKWIARLLGGFLILEALGVFGYFGYLRPYQKAVNMMPMEGQMCLEVQDDGVLLLSWPEGIHQDRYLIRVLDGEDVLWQDWTEQASCMLPALPVDRSVELCVSSARGYRFLFPGGERLRMGQTDLRVTASLAEPKVEALTWTPDVETQTVRLGLELPENTKCRMYQVKDGEKQLFQTLDQKELILDIGDEGDFPIPTVEESLNFCFDAYRTTPGLIYYGSVTERTQIFREDLLARDLKLKHEDLGNNVYRFSWIETKGDYYEVQRLDAETESWKTLQRVELGDKRSYTTGHLDKYTEYQFRVVAVGGQTLPDSEYAAISENITLKTGTTAVYSTVWPVQELEVYSDAKKTKVLGKIPDTDGYCVLDVQDGMFRIRYGKTYGYIDSNYCLIDLSEFLGDLCLYDITNSYASLFMAHDYELPTVTGKVIVGYEKVKLSDGRQLVPLLYPTALRLEKAAFAAAEKGYKLKIYDAYRPREATKAVYDQAVALSDQPIPEKTYTGKVHTDLKLPVQETTTPTTQPTQPTVTDQPTEEIVTEPVPTLTYHDLMTDFGRYAMNYFLANGKSRHNRGIALDLTLADMKTGKDLKMQTPMHDLSWYSENARDNQNARTLSAIMESVGFSGLKSEWWHFNDLEAQDTYQPQWRMKGVSAQCWMADDEGWRYRKSNGKYYVNCTETLDGVTYTFDAEGYAVNEQGERL